MTREKTPKQKLREHIDIWHSAKHTPKKNATLLELQTWHGNQHHRFSPNHFHLGANLGPGARPEGWRTGEGAVRNDLPFTDLRKIVEDFKKWQKRLVSVRTAKALAYLAVNLPRMLGSAATQSVIQCGRCHGSKKVDLR